MVTFASKSIAFLLGAIVWVLSVWGIYAPDRLTKLVKGVVDKDWVSILPWSAGCRWVQR